MWASRLGDDTCSVSRRAISFRTVHLAGDELVTVAEGIETHAEREYLLDQTSIRLGQGFLLERPFFIGDPSSQGSLQAA